MATVTISLAGSAIVNGSKNWTISDADVQTLIDSIIDKKATAPTVPPTPPPTQQQALVIWAQSFIDATIKNDTDYRTAKARQELTVTPIVFT